MITTDVINFESQYSLIIVGPARTEALIPLLREGEKMIAQNLLLRLMSDDNNLVSF